MVKKSSQRSIAHGQYPGKAFKIWLFGRLNVRLDDPSGWIHNKQNALAWRSRNQKNRNISRKGRTGKKVSFGALGAPFRSLNVA
jgi:hypothetical protein